MSETTSETASEIARSIGVTTIETVVRRAIERPAAVVREWRVRPVRGGATDTPIWRVSGEADDGRETTAWSVVLKCKSHDDGTGAGVPEVEAYRSGLLERLRDCRFGFVAPRCYLVEPGPPPREGEDATTWLWLEDVADPGRARELDARVFEGYLDGLSDAGWRLDRRLRDEVRFGYAAHAPLNMGLFAGGGIAAAFGRAWIRCWFERVLGRPLEELCEPLAALTGFTLDLADEARRLGRGLGPLT